MNKALNPTVYCEIHYNKKHGTNQTLPRSGQTEYISEKGSCLSSVQVSKSPATTQKGLQSSLGEIGEPMQTSISTLHRYCLYGRVAKRNLLLRKAILENLRAVGKRFFVV